VTKRFLLQNLGALGEAGKSLFSIGGIPYATRLIEEGWIPCGTSISPDGEVLQTFYLPVDIDPEGPDERR